MRYLVEDLTYVTNYERALQGWSILAFAARNQQILSYHTIEKLTGVPRLGVGQFLGPIQSYCRKHDLPPLTAIVIKEDTGLPSGGFTAATDIVCAQARVFVFDWLSKGAPTVEELEQAHKTDSTSA
jgi:hypothetical protein